MPAVRPRASFDPISPNLDIAALVENTENFEYVVRISRDTIDEQGIDAFEKLVLLHVIIGGKPLVVEGFQNRLEPWTFSAKWLKDNLGSKEEDARNITKKDPLRLTIGHYLNNVARLARQWTPQNYRDPARQRIYLKDIDCPQVWEDKLREQIPGGLFYWNESTGDIGGPGAVDEPNPNGTGKKKGRGIARAGDLMSSLPKDMRAVNLMCYIGHEGTYTPAHREMCACLGQNIMVETSGLVDEEGKPEQPGSSIWFMTESKDRHMVSEYWLSVLGHDIEVEDHFAQIAAWRRAPFKTYVVEQRAGDFILIPPLAPHQVWNRGTRTMKVAWNRTTVETLELAMSEALPRARMVCRDEQYKNKAIIYFTLQKYSGLLARAKTQQAKEKDPATAAALKSGPKIRQLQKDFKRLFKLFQDILLSEMFSTDVTEPKCQYLAFDSNVTCAYCRGNIFNRFLTCETCAGALEHGVDEPYDVCMDCYAMGRSCWCMSKYKWVEQFKWKDLAQKYDEWRKQIVDFDGSASDLNRSLEEARDQSTKKSLAHICQEALKERPWRDWTEPAPEEDLDENEEEEIEVNDNGTVKKTKKRKSEAWLSRNPPCHTCGYRHPSWKMATCTNCSKSYCYGSLFRAFDLMPPAIMENPWWECPHCLKICNVGKCKRDPRQKPYEPKGTLLGHDTRKVADARSIESLVDFSVSNLSWIREDIDAPLESVRLKRHQEEAEKAKQDEAMLDDRYVDEDDGAHANGQQDDDESMIDPSLRGKEGSNGQRRPIGRQTDRLPSVSTLLEGTRRGAPEGYEPARHPPGIASAAGFDGQDEDYAYPDPDGSHSLTAPTVPAMGQGHPNSDSIKLTQSKKRKTTDEQQTPKAVNDATLQYIRHQQKKTLEEARKAGQFVRVQAQLQGKRKVVRLSLGKDTLSQIKTSEEAQRRSSAPDVSTNNGGEVNEDVILVQSDVRPAPAPKPSKTVAKNSVKDKQVRYRVETDDDFEDFENRDHARRSANFNAALSKPPKRTYEEISIASDEEAIDLNNAADQPTTNGAPPTKKPRISAYLVRKHQDEPDLPDELPDNRKDARPRNDNAKPRVPRQAERNASGKSQQGRGRRGRKSMPVAAQTVIEQPVSIEDDAEGEPDEDIVMENAEGNIANGIADSPAPAPQSPRAPQHPRPRSPTSIAKEALTIAASETPVEPSSPIIAPVRAGKTTAEIEEEENRKAKLMAAGIDPVSDNVSATDASESESESVKEAEISKPVPKLNGSIFSKPGMQGKKIKIVSVATATTVKKKPTATLTISKSTTVTNATKAGRGRREEDDDIEDATESSGTEIPARVRDPAQSSPARKGRGRPSLVLAGSVRGKMVPTRGRGSGRGRGRPRKTI